MRHSWPIKVSGQYSLQRLLELLVLILCLFYGICSALYVSTCMQNATSGYTTGII
jgi:hypothetical protein